MSLFTELNAEVINDQDEHDCVPLVVPEAWSHGSLEFSLQAKAFGEEIVC